MTQIAPTFLELMRRQDHFAGVDQAGWLPMARGPHDVAKAQAKDYFGGMLARFRLSSPLLAALRETIELAQEEGIPAALVLMPEGPRFRSWYPPGTWEQIEQALRRLVGECGVPLVDLRDCVPEEDFCDSHHPYPEGATRLTRRLAVEIEPLLRQVRPEAR
jgi:hypothetical protein